MRIFLSTDTVGGVWDYTATLASELHSAGHAVFLAVLGEPDERRLAQLPSGVEVACNAFRLEWMPGAERDIAPAGEWLCDAARRWRADVVHLNQLAYAAHRFAAPTLVVVHSDVLSWFSETLGCAAPEEWRPYTRWVRAGLEAADVVVAPSAYQSGLALRHYGRGADRVIHNGIRPPSDLSTEPSRPCVLSVGRAWDEAKGMAVLDHAAGLLREEGLAVHLFGETVGPHGQRFEARHLSAHGRAARDEVDGWMRRCSLYVGASLYEPFGLAPLEAALHGCALVLSDIPSFRELWDGCAEFFPRGNGEALAEVLRRLGRDAQARSALALAADTRARRLYTAERFAGEYLTLYREMRRSGSAPAPTPVVDPPVAWAPPG